MRRQLIEPPAHADIETLASRAQYIGSPAHKTYPSFAGTPRPRGVASKCDWSLGDQDELTGWLREAILAHCFGAPWEQDFPRYVWAERGGVYYEARLTNAARGDYKGYPITESEYRSIS